MLLKALILFAVPGAVSLVAGTVGEIPIAGGLSLGCFNCIAPPLLSPQPNITFQGLTRQDSSFFPFTTVNGFYALDAPAIAQVVEQVNDLGAFVLAPTPATYSGTFMLGVHFFFGEGGFVSHVIDPGVFVGSVSDSGVGNVTISFALNEIVVPFDYRGGGSFLFTINPLTVNATGLPAALTGQISNVTFNSPEPKSGILFGLGLVLVLWRMRYCPHTENAVCN